MKIDDKEIDSDISARVGTYQDDCLKDLKGVKIKLNQIVDDEFKRLVGDNVTDLYQWNNYSNGKYKPNDRKAPPPPPAPAPAPAPAPNSETYYDDFLKSKCISIEEKLLYISRYGIKEDNQQNSDKFIKDIIKQKGYIEKRKKELASEAKKVIEVYKRVLSENQKEIETLSAEIISAENIIKENNKVIQAIMSFGKSQTALDPEQVKQVENLRKENVDLQKEISGNKIKLTEYREAQKVYQVKIDKAIREFRKSYGVSADKIIEDTDSEKESSENSVNTNGVGGQSSKSGLVPNKNESEKQIAKRMLENMSTMNWSQFMDMVQENGFQDVEDAKKHLGFFDRRRLNKKLAMYLGDICGKEYSCGKYLKNKQTGEIEYKETFKYNIVDGKIVKNNKKMRYEDYNQILNEIETFNMAIENGATYKQIEEFNKKIKFVYLAALYNGGKRFSPFYGIRNELRNSLAEFSKLNYQIQSKVATKENRLRTAYGLRARESINPKPHNVVKTGTGRIKTSTEPKSI